MKRTSIASLTLVALAALSAGCDSEEEGLDEELSAEHEPLVRGEILTPATNKPDYNAVVRLQLPGLPGTVRYCVGTKIGDKRFLTAAHCLVNTSSTSTFKLTSSLDGKALETTLNVLAVATYPKFANAFINTKFRQHDVGIIDVEELTPSIPKLGLFLDRVGDGVAGTVVAYGCDPNGPEDKKRRATFTTLSKNAIAARLNVPDVGEDIAAASYAHMVVFDGTSPKPYTCVTNSGAPFLINVNNTLQVAAVHSFRIDADTFTFFERVGGIKRWIDIPKVNQVIGGGWGTFISDHSNLCLGLPGTNPDAQNTAMAQLYCDGSKRTHDPQYWRLKATNAAGVFQLRIGSSPHDANDFPSRCLTIVGNALMQRPCGAAAGQLWRLEQSNGRIKLRADGGNQCVGIVKNPNDEFASQKVLLPVTLATCGSATAHQSWVFSN